MLTGLSAPLRALIPSMSLSLNMPPKPSPFPLSAPNLIPYRSFLLPVSDTMCRLVCRERRTLSTIVNSENYFTIQFNSRIIFPLPFSRSHLLSLNLIKPPTPTAQLQPCTHGTFYPTETRQANDGTERGCDVRWKEHTLTRSLSLSSSNFLKWFGSRMTVSFVIQRHNNLSGLSGAC